MSPIGSRFMGRRFAFIGLLGLLAVISGWLFVLGGSQPASADEVSDGASVAVWPGVNKLHSKSSFVVMGSGYVPGQTIRVLLQTSVGRGFSGTVQNDITENLIPAANAVDSAGNFASRFDMGRFERVVFENVISLSITDEDYNVLATAPVILCDPDGRSRVGVYKRKAPDYLANPDDPRPATFCGTFFEYPQRPE